MAKQKAGPAKRTILIVDDEVGILEVLEFILGDAGFAVVSAINGQERADLYAKDRTGSRYCRFYDAAAGRRWRYQGDAR